MGFSADRLLSRLQHLPSAHALRVAFSGGCDSTVLLHALASLRAQIPVAVSAVHVNHDLHPDAADWSRRCEEFCRGLGIPCTTLRVDARPLAGESREAAARRARYAALGAALGEGEALLTAHHGDDQAETFLLQLLRGAGPRGLASMGEVSPFARGMLVRPLLEFERHELEEYARQHALRWTDDPSNADTGFDRNYLRHRLLPLLAERWPAADRVIARAARLQAEASLLQDELAAIDCAVTCGEGGVLRLQPLKSLSRARQRNLLRYALRMRGLPLPSEALLERVVVELVHAREDAAPLVAWPGAEVRRYRDRIHLLPPLAPAPHGARLAWDGREPLGLPAGLGSLRAVAAIGQGIRAAGRLEVGFRSGGERCRLPGRRHRHTLKHLLQEAGVPPWERERLPLLFIDGELAAVADLWICDGFAAGAGEMGIRLHWQRLAIETEGQNGDNLPG